LTTRYIRESKWQVTLQTGAPTLQTITKTLDAPTQEIAIHRAQAAYPNLQFIQVSATQLDPQTAAPTQDNASTPTGNGMLPGVRPLASLQALKQPWPAQNPQQTESIPNPKSFAYPYSISLPGQFSRVLRETSPVRVFEQAGHHRIILETEHDMRGFLSRLQTHHDRQMVNSIIAGMRSSLYD
jgi:hypothetical protein